MSNKKSDKPKPKKNNGLFDFIKNNKFNNQSKASSNSKSKQFKH